MKNLVAGVCALVCAFALVPASGASEVSGNVVGVSDGDTITVLDEKKATHKIRLAAIDAPEKGQPFSNVAKNRLSELVQNRSVIVKVDTKDRYGREVGRVFVLVDVNELLVREGLAFHYLYYNPDDAAMASAEAFARQNGLGVWSLPNGGQRPWDFRRGKKSPRSRGNSGDSPEPLPVSQSAENPPTGVPAEKSEVSEKRYWVTRSSGKVHNASCKNFKNTNGYLTENPSGPNCKICGGTELVGH